MGHDCRQSQEMDQEQNLDAERKKDFENKTKDFAIVANEQAEMDELAALMALWK